MDLVDDEQCTREAEAAHLRVLDCDSSQQCLIYRADRYRCSKKPFGLLGGPTGAAEDLIGIVAPLSIEIRKAANCRRPSHRIARQRAHSFEPSFWKQAIDRRLHPRVNLTRSYPS